MTRHDSSACHAPHRRRRHQGHQRHHDRKERVLHTRISEQLAEDIRQFADELRVPASNLVRNVLEEVFTMVDRVSGDVGDLFDDLISEAEGVRERVRDQAASRQRGSEGRSRRRRRRWSDAEPADVEAELRADEASERSGAFDDPASDDPKSGDGRQDDRGGNAAAPEADRPRAAELFPEILGWQPLVLNRELACGRCGRSLSAGESAFLGVGEQGLTQTALCGRCAGRR